MKVTPCQQPRIHGQPIIIDPVSCEMNIPLFYADTGEWEHPIVCSRDFSITVLHVMENVLKPENCGLVHLGIYSARKARHKDGSPIIPERWSNHSYGEAMDFSGVVCKGIQIGIKDMKKVEPSLLKRIIDGCETAIKGIGRLPEIVDEESWFHIGIWPRKAK